MVQFMLGYFLVGIPLGALLTFNYDMGLVGLQWGNVAAAVCMLISGQFTLGNVDMQAKADEAQARFKKEEEIKINKTQEKLQ
jgi:Na+-driven multidrug efflux pump